jgi:hypothetical protein
MEVKAHMDPCFTLISGCLIACVSRLAPNPHPASCTTGTCGPFSGGKARPERDADHSSHLIRRSWLSRSYTSSLPLRLHMCIVALFTFYYIKGWEFLDQLSDSLAEGLCATSSLINLFESVPSDSCPRGWAQPQCRLCPLPACLPFVLTDVGTHRRQTMGDIIALSVATAAAMNTARPAKTHAAC